jgi:hypothetical protein
MSNPYGLDSRYFKEKLGMLVRDADSYTPEGMQLALQRLAEVAGSQVTIKPKYRSTGTKTN